MIIEKCKTLDNEQFDIYYDKLNKFVDLKRFHPMKKFDLNIDENSSTIIKHPVTDHAQS